MQMITQLLLLPILCCRHDYLWHCLFKYYVDTLWLSWLMVVDLAVCTWFEMGKCYGQTVTAMTAGKHNLKTQVKQDLKNIKNVKRCRDGTPKSMRTR